jgi:hypothetical protein
MTVRPPSVRQPTWNGRDGKTSSVASSPASRSASEETDREVGREGAAGDPSAQERERSEFSPPTDDALRVRAHTLLVAVDDPLLAVLAFLGLAPEVAHVRAGKGLADGEADRLLGLKDLGHNLLLERVRPKVENGREANDVAAAEAVAVAAGAAESELLRDR